MKVTIVSGGNAPSQALLENELSSSSFLICADGGGNCLYKYNIKPDYLMGDFDSISAEALKFFKSSGSVISEYPAKKNFTDTEAVFSKAVELNADEITFLGCTGSRLDHFMGSMGMLKKSLEHGIRAYIKDENNSIEILDKSSIIKGKRGELFSLYAYCDIVENLNIIGAKYKLNNYNLTLGDSRTVSNEFLDGEVSVSFKSGLILLFRSRD
ncbi:MAG: thiamine diphosphokinase [Clostridium sp.]|jgi:thiamine pyrophosphokinase|uniref:thiamine diphosphokinase n=1 Tax=Clostridium sp. TaxID=1506 RepID=UPI0025C547E7|nr:thiamine diphosphokinase [Clostridium sp.]MCH3964033.1 thiamine diphosphokinase [Clostridium sp.]MCI1716234.1 thiamine diphosphokinase [Clostridium sp.]MCI1800526.1 thiamine diphosphokinase [Clostridium sp.]MCI1814411.1 thiamine diphosphokinase [Clostridium sp.]MCI1871310.1 thiamine diphosphokinase [Clostridium sp.]